MSIDKDRLAAFTDAIVAIAATIMVLELAAPEDATMNGLLSQWPTFVAYLVSFNLIYLTWLNHHNAFKKIDHVTTGVFVWNGIWTFFLTLVPFATKWVGEHPYDVAPEALYVVVLFAWSLAFQLMDNRIAKDFPEVGRDATNRAGVRALMYLRYAVALAVAFFAPIAALMLILVTNVVLTVGMFRMARGASGDRADGAGEAR